jgi:hypothetical protein
MAFGKHPAIVDGEVYGQLKCKCGSEYLHQGNITIFQRVEDDSTTTVIAQDGKTVQASDFPSDDTCNPSPRRHGLILEFDCEECGVEWEPNADGGESAVKHKPPQRLAIFQHKGNTFMEWL